jgi:hypothetical protein
LRRHFDGEKELVPAMFAPIGSDQLANFLLYPIRHPPHGLVSQTFIVRQRENFSFIVDSLSIYEIFKLPGSESSAF